MLTDYQHLKINIFTFYGIMIEKLVYNLHFAPNIYYGLKRLTTTSGAKSRYKIDSYVHHILDSEYTC